MHTLILLTYTSEAFSSGARGLNFDQGFHLPLFFVCASSEGSTQQDTVLGHHQPASETPFKWRFTGGLMVARHF